MTVCPDTAGMDSNAPRWSSDVRQADWIAPRLAPWGGDYPAAVVVPAGFEAYARVLHPAQVPEHGDRLVRWAEVAAWSGMPLRQDAQFHSIALPRTAPSEPLPYHSQGPREGSLYVPDAEVLARILRDWTATPEDCWFCVWDGYGWDSASSFFAAAASAETGQLPETVAPPKRDPVPGPVREAPRVQLPHRGYLLYQGPAEAALVLPGLDGTFGQCPNLWWPADRAWCVASEIGLSWTYIGGPRGLIDAIGTDDRIEALPAAPNDRVSRVEDWVAAWVDQLFEGLLAHGAGSLSTPRGSVDAWLRRSHGIRHGDLRIEVTGLDGVTGSSWALLDRGEERLPSDVRSYLTSAVLSLTGK
jgi:hypothetical protein